MERNSALLTDLYELTMAEGYWKEGLREAEACFYMHFRNNPFEGGYAVACGLDHLSRIIDDFTFTDDDIDYLGSLTVPSGNPLFDKEFLEYMRGYKLHLDVDATPEGTVVFPQEPMVRVRGPLVECQLIEPALLNAVNFETLIATKAARICNVTKGSVAEFGLRRAQGPDGGLRASRAAFIGGCTSTSNVLCGQVFGIPVSGTHAHSWVMSFDTELEAFRAFAQAMPENTILLVDTYDVMEGVENAIIVGKEMEERGDRLIGIRLDSGDLAWESKKAREMLDAAGLDYVKIFATNDLDEFTIDSLERQGARIDSWGVGTKLAVAYDQPALGGVYKMSAVKQTPDSQWEPKIKLSAQIVKRTLPGILDVRRYIDEDGMYCGDMIFDELSGVSNEMIVDPVDPVHTKMLSGRLHKTLLEPLARGGRSVYRDTDCREAQERARAEMSRLDPSYTRFLNPGSYPVGLEVGLYETREQLIREHNPKG